MTRLTRAASTVERFLRRLDRKLGIDHTDRSEWVWAVPAGTMVVTLGMCLFLGLTTQMGIAVAIPVGVIGALFMGGLSVAYMTPVEEGADAEPGRGVVVAAGAPRSPSGVGPPAWWALVEEEAAAPEPQLRGDSEPAAVAR